MLKQFEEGRLTFISTNHPSNYFNQDYSAQISHLADALSSRSSNLLIE
ncbi:hypothetical protein NIES4102_42180 (plasmid) [Chondrocystis sp. NIES-4102]|nr:hypothetical protein NIES4102_41090 [Chondrocystis sp. NIES-4102]BAZ47172.1 hypothetical protein NIES4102_42180 [Chondrocystis sp. NIES-4102]